MTLLEANDLGNLSHMPILSCLLLLVSLGDFFCVQLYKEHCQVFFMDYDKLKIIALHTGCFFFLNIYMG